jgi:type III pantothenate kinase
MAPTNAFPLMAVDIGNTCVKLADFEHANDLPLPLPAGSLTVGHNWVEAELEPFVTRKPAAYAWWIASVNRPAAARLLDWLKARGVDRPRLMMAADLPLAVDVALPDAVGVDRLLNAVSVNKLRARGRPAIAVSFGSAIVVDYVSASGAFAGGAILPGVAMSARALHTFTDLLPLIEIAEAPPVLGTSTEDAMRSGMFWGAVGAVRELVNRLAEGQGPIQVFLTGGGAAPYAAILAQQTEHAAQFVPHLTLSGIALSALEAGAASG